MKCGKIDMTMTEIGSVFEHFDLGMVYLEVKFENYVPVDIKYIA